MVRPRGWFRSSSARLTAVATGVVVAGALIVPLASTATAEPAGNTEFFSSFEPGDPRPTWTDTVETGPSGKPKTGGVTSADPTRIAGDISDQIVEVTANGENTGAGEVAENLVDFDPGSKWLVFEPTGWAQFRFDQPVTITRYALTSANDHPERDPRDWTLLGSVDGEDWAEIDSRQGESFSDRFQTKEYAVDTGTAYRYYRLDITRNGSGDIVQLAEVQFAGKDAKPSKPHMGTAVGNGPTSAPAAKTKVGFTGTHALRFVGSHSGKGRAYSYNKVFDVDVKVTPKTTLSYVIFPELLGDLTYPSTYVAVDLAFTDGTYLSDLSAKDRRGVPVHPRRQGEAKTLYADQWNNIVADIGKVAAGKTVDRILVGYDNPAAGDGGFRGWIDDIRLTAKQPEKRYDSVADYVITTRGTHSSGAFSRGNNFPATAVPHGFNFWSPMTDAGSISWLYSYHAHNNAENKPDIEAFTVSHEPSPWMGDRQTFQVMPSPAEGTPDADRKKRALAFSHDDEVAKAHYYRVKFDNGIVTEFAPTDHAAIFRFRFPGAANLIFDNVNNDGGLTLDPENRTVTGYSDVKSGLSEGAGRMFVYATFDKPVTDSGMLPGGGGKDVTGFFKFGNADTVTMRIATSLISVEQARKNLELEIAPSDTLETVRDRAKRAWEEKLKVVEVEGATEDQLITLYSNLYRLFLYPNSGFENVGTKDKPKYAYASPFVPKEGNDTPTHTGSKIVDGKVYVNNGFWDTYRTTWPAYALLTPKQAGEMIDGFVQQYRDGGWIARWSSPGYANLMTGTSSDVAFADAYTKGIENFDVKGAYEAGMRNATVTPPNDNVGRKGLRKSIFRGYTPTSTHEGMSWALEGYLNDFGLANMAQLLADRAKDPAEKKRYAEEAEYLRNRALNYVHMFDERVGFFQGRDDDGNWRLSPDEYDPRVWGYDYTETNGWNMAFTVPHDGQGLANLYGGRDKLAKKLDEFFATPETAKFTGSYGGVIHEMVEARDVRMGQYGHSNQPSHHIPYMYNYAGEPAKTQKLVREITSRLYLGSEIGQGYPGDEDNGEHSAWWVFSALGFYPLQMGSPNYAIGSPLFTKATVHLENGKKLVIKARNNSPQNVYVQDLKVDGKPYHKTYLPHSLLADGAVLEFTMGPKPSKWGTGAAALPPSLTKGSKVPQPLADVLPNSSAATDDDSNTEAAVTEVTFEAKRPGELVEFYTITSGKSAGSDPGRWVLRGSRDGKKWTVLDQRSDETFTWRQQTRPFKVAKPGKYTYYRLEFVGDARVAEVELLAKPGR
jgi:predicted alpha-1,2-mannosidase